MLAGNKGVLTNILMISEHVFPVHLLNSLNQPESSFGLHRYRLGSKVGQAEYPHRHDFNQVIYITGGQGTHVVDFYSLPVKPPMLYFVSAGQVHFWQVEEPLRGFSLHFSPDLLTSTPAHAAEFDILALFHSLSYRPLRLNPEQASFTQQIMEMVVREYEVYNDESVLSAYLQILLANFVRLCKELEPEITLSPAAELVRRYKRQVSLHFFEHHSVQFYADQLGVSMAHLSRCVREVTGYTASEIIRQELVIEAKRLLANTDLVVERVSNQLSFNDPAYFGRFFKRETGFSPGAFRTSILRNYQARHRPTESAVRFEASPD